MIASGEAAGRALLLPSRIRALHSFPWTLWVTCNDPFTESSSTGWQGLPTVTFPMQSGRSRMWEKSQKKWGSILKTANFG